MLITGKMQHDATEDERLDKEMEDEIFEQKKHLSKYIDNINSLLGKSRSKEVRKSMIQFLVESL
jgi:hypothetical protein